MKSKKILMALASLLIIVVMLSSCSLSFLTNFPDLGLGTGSSSNTGTDTGSNAGTSNDSDYTFDENTPIEGVSLASAYINEKGELILVYTNGKSQNLGVVVGKDGSSSSGDVDINITGTGADVSSIVTKGIKSAVSVVCKTENKSTIFEEGGKIVSAGAGVIYKLDKKTGDAYIITNYHVVYDDSSFNTSNGICNNISLYAYGAHLDQYAIPAKYIGGSPNYDIAVLKVTGSSLLKNSIYSEVEVAEFNSAYAGDVAVAIGNPGGSGIAATSGIVSADSEYIVLDIAGEAELRVMRIDTPVNPGNSGGGLFNKNGQLIGIVNAKTVETNVESVGYAIPISIAKSVADNIIYYCDGTSKEAVQRPMFGIEIKINASKAVYTEDGKIAVEEEIVVNSITAGSIADGKMKAGDIIKSVTINGTTYKVTRLFNTIDAMLNARVGDTVITTVERNGQIMDISIVITAGCITQS